MSRINDFRDGIAYLLRGFKLLFSTPRLMLLSVLPTLINLFLLFIMLAAFVHYYGSLYGWLSFHIGHLDIANPTAWYWHLLDGVLWVLDLIFQILIVLMSLILLLIVSYGLSFIVAAPFNDMLSERVEIMLTGKEAPPFTTKKFISDLARTTRIESVKALILLSIPAVLFVLNIIPVVGGPLYIVSTLIFGAWDLGFSYADLPMGRKVVPLKERWGFAKKNKWALIGLGAGFAIPFFTLIFVSPIVIGGTALYVERTKRD